MWRERALRAEAAMAKPPESPAVATMFQQHAASLREEVKATIEAALKEDRAPLKDDRPPPLEAAPPSPPSPPSLEGADDAPPAPLSPWRQAAQEAREDLAVSTERTSEADDAFSRLMAKQHALAGEARGRPGAHPGGPGRVPARNFFAGPRAPDVRPPAGAAAAAYIQLRAPFVYTPPRAGLPADEPGPAGVVGGRDAEFEGLLKFINHFSYFPTYAYRKGGGGNAGVEPAPRTGSEPGVRGANSQGAGDEIASASGVGSSIIRQVCAPAAHEAAPGPDAAARLREAAPRGPAGRESGGLTASEPYASQGVVTRRRTAITGKSMEQISPCSQSPSPFGSIAEGIPRER